MSEAALRHTLLSQTAGIRCYLRLEAYAGLSDWRHTLLSQTAGIRCFLILEAYTAILDCRTCCHRLPDVPSLLPAAKCCWYAMYHAVISASHTYHACLLLFRSAPSPCGHLRQPCLHDTFSFTPWLRASRRLGTPWHHDVDGCPFPASQPELCVLLLHRCADVVPFFLTLLVDVSLILPL
jgi:hypothetical protein